MNNTVPPDIAAADRAIKQLYDQAHAIGKGVQERLIGRIVKRHNDLYKITWAGLGNGHIDLRGVKVNGKKVGTREFHVGYAILCEFVNEQLTR